ncbi:MAG: hypothetical protein ACKOES_09405, partial [Planctomycetaceae bacterium]
MSEFHAVGLPGLAGLGAARGAAGAITSVAGGGTILTWPVRTASLPETAGRLVAEYATSSVGVLGGAVAAEGGYGGARLGLALC